MKLIVSNLDILSGYITREFYYVITELTKAYGWKQIETRKLWKGPGTLQSSLLSKFGELPETVLFWESYEFLKEHADDIRSLGSHKVILADDLNWRDGHGRRMKELGFELCDLVLSTYAYAWENFFPEIDYAKVVWIPHSASPDFMLSYNESPENQVLLSGAINRHYPMRLQMQELLSRDPEAIAHHIHPGYYRRYQHRVKGDVGPGYAVKIHNYRAAFTDSLTFKYVVAKYFEIPATGALLLADDSVREPLITLGFKENEHYVSTTSETLEAKIRYVRDEKNHAELDEIRKRGQALVWEKHKTSDRARQINEACEANQNQRPACE
jgi:hypothetical protein